MNTFVDMTTNDPNTIAEAADAYRAAVDAAFNAGIPAATTFRNAAKAIATQHALYKFQSAMNAATADGVPVAVTAGWATKDIVTLNAWWAANQNASHLAASDEVNAQRALSKFQNALSRFALDTAATRAQTAGRQVLGVSEAAASDDTAADLAASDEAAADLAAVEPAAADKAAAE